MIQQKDGDHADYQLFNGTAYHTNTPPKLVALLEAWRLERRRLLFIYGDPKTGIPWDEMFPNRGTIGRSTGEYKIPLLIKTKRSLGGEMLMDAHILEVRESRGGKVLYQVAKPAAPKTLETTQRADGSYSIIHPE